MTLRRLRLQPWRRPGKFVSSHTSLGPERERGLSPRIISAEAPDRRGIRYGSDGTSEPDSQPTNAPLPPAHRAPRCRRGIMSAGVIFLPCRDSDAMAAACRRELDLPRDIARELGHSALRAIQAGRYLRADGVEVDWRDDVAAAVEARISPT